jgi:hypothetical protein
MGKRGEVVTRQEQAKFRRLEKRRNNLFTALCIIKTWMSFVDNPKDTLFHIAKLVTEKIEEEKLAEKKEVRDADND